MSTSNNASERSVGHRGPRLARQGGLWPAAQLDRYTAVDGEVTTINAEGSCQVLLPNEIVLAISQPTGRELALGDRLRFRDLRLDVSVEVENLTQGWRFIVSIPSNNAHDLRLPSKHGGSRTPSMERLNGR